MSCKINSKVLKKLVVLLLFVLATSGLAADEATDLTKIAPTQDYLLAEIFILFGCIFILAAGIGMFRFPDFYTRLHASSKLVTSGGIGIFVGAAIAFVSETAIQRVLLTTSVKRKRLLAIQRVLLTAFFFFLTTPLAGYMIARAGYLRGLKPYREAHSVDEWQACGAAVEET